MTVVICGQTFELSGVQLGHPITHRAVNFDPVAALGTTLIDEQRLVIRDGMAPAAERDTVLHEVIHAVLRLTSAVGAFKTRRREERVTNALAVGLLAVLRENPRLVAWLVESER